MMIKDSGCFWIFPVCISRKKAPQHQTTTAQPLNAEEKNKDDENEQKKPNAREKIKKRKKEHFYSCLRKEKAPPTGSRQKKHSLVCPQEKIDRTKRQQHNL